MQETSTRKIYDVQASFYDRVFGRMVRARIGRAVESHLALRAGDHVLDLGIGTGNSLDHYPPETRVFGIDLSVGMLKQCRRKITDRGMGNISILQGNALRLPFADSTFDRILISHVISVVSDPVGLLREAQRVAKPYARIVMVNHFLSSNPLIAKVEKWLSPVCTRIGWRSDLSLADLLKQTGVEVDYRFKLEHIDLWQTVVISNSKPGYMSLPMNLPVLAT